MISLENCKSRVTYFDGIEVWQFWARTHLGSWTRWQQGHPKAAIREMFATKWFSWRFEGSDVAKFVFDMVNIVYYIISTIKILRGHRVVFDLRRANHFCFYFALLSFQLDYFQQKLDVLSINGPLIKLSRPILWLNMKLKCSRHYGLR